MNQETVLAERASIDAEVDGKTIVDYLQRNVERYGDDPAIHYFSVKQASGYALFYDSDPILSGSVALDTYFPNNPGWSHITFFNSGWPDNGVPEPATWAMLLLGFGAIGATLRARKAGSGDRRLRVA